MNKQGGQPIIIVRKKVHGHGGHHGGAWKVAYADFVTAMMAFFMVMWILGMDQSLKESIEGYFSNPIGYKKGYSAGSSPMSNGQSPVRASAAGFPLLTRTGEKTRMDTASSRIRSKMSKAGLSSLAAQVEFQYSAEGLRIELVEDASGSLFFQIASATPHKQLTTLLTVIGQELAPLGNPLVVEGHTDAATYSGKYSNWELSTDRANAARRVLEEAGVSSGRIVEVRGFADRQPRVTENSLDPRNRRITILLPFVTRAEPEVIATTGD